jgi:nucleoside-diphosphate-sugar epimerase
LVTGATGFIGSHLVKRLLKESAEASCLVEPGADTSELESLGGLSGISSADLTDERAVRRVVSGKKPSVVFHLAAVGVADPGIDPLRAVKVNVEGTLNLLDALDGSFDLFLNTGTCHEYGSAPAPFRETTPPAPGTVYAASKVAAWHFCNLFFDIRGWPIATLCLFTVYGPRQSPKTLVPSVILSALTKRELPMTSGDQVRDFIFVDDVVEGFLLAAKNPASAGKTINLCSGRGVSLRELVSKVEALVGPVPVNFGLLPPRPGEASEIIGDNSVARELLGWVPKVGLEEGLALTVEWFRQGVKEGIMHRDSSGAMNGESG